jgi:hypothetical protein
VALVMMGRAQGLSPLRHRAIAGGLGGFPGHAEEHFRHFSQALAAGDFDGDGHADLAIGVPLENPFGIGDAGGELVLYGSLFADGFDAGPGEMLWTELVP